MSHLPISEDYPPISPFLMIYFKKSPLFPLISKPQRLQIMPTLFSLGTVLPRCHHRQHFPSRLHQPAHITPPVCPPASGMSSILRPVRRDARGTAAGWIWRAWGRGRGCGATWPPGILPLWRISSTHEEMDQQRCVWCVCVCVCVVLRCVCVCCVRCVCGLCMYVVCKVCVCVCV